MWPNISRAAQVLSVCVCVFVQKHVLTSRWRASYMQYTACDTVVVFFLNCFIVNVKTFDECCAQRRTMTIHDLNWMDVIVRNWHLLLHITITSLKFIFINSLTSMRAIHSMLVASLSVSSMLCHLPIVHESMHLKQGPYNLIKHQFSEIYLNVAFCYEFGSFRFQFVYLHQQNTIESTIYGSNHFLFKMLMLCTCCSVC